jgi:DNA-binding response OmpR family regulator
MGGTIETGRRSARTISETAGAASIRTAWIVFDRATYSVTVRGRPVILTATEFDLLGFLLQNRDRVVGHVEIAHSVLGAAHGDTALLVRVHICHLRRALGGDRGLISTMRGRGYRIRVD